MNFATLCDVLDSVRSTKGFSEKSKLLKTFFKSLRDDQQDLFPVLRLVVPKLDRERPSYRLKESKISKLLIKMLGLCDGHDKTLLQKSIVGTSIDFVDAAYSVLKKYIVNKEIGLSVQKINEFLDTVANRPNDIDLDDLVLDIFLKLSPKNIKFLIQMILKDLKLGISDNSILNCFHEDGANFYATNSNLKNFCEVLSNPQVKLNELEIEIFHSFRPMLSKRCDASNFKKCFPDSKTFIIENKFDGERFQLHMSDHKFKYFSRNGYDYTETYGASFNSGIFTPKLRNVFAPDTQTVILDGEMMLWNKQTGNFGSKGMNLDVKKLGAGKYQPCFCVFDILLHNNRVLTNQPLQKRLSVLKNVIKNPVIGTIVISEYLEVNSCEDIVNALNSSVDKNEEGIVVKDVKSVYKCSDRNSGWFKVKMEYFDDVVHDLDVLMMGGTYGTTKKINSFVVGVNSGPDTYLSFGRISSGLNDTQLEILNDRLNNQGVDFKLFQTKSQGKLHFGREIPDVYIEPENSLILQIRATELIRSTSDAVKCPYTLRFPRVLKIRDDKPVDECFSMNELLELTNQNQSVIKLNKRHIELDEITAKAKSAKKIKFEVVKSDLLSDSGEFLKGLKFYVNSGTQKLGLDDIHRAIKKAGGEISYRIEPNIDVVLVSKITKKISEVMQQSNHFDIIHVDWLQRVMEYRELVEYEPREIFCKGTNFRREIGGSLDRFGDSFCEQTTKESLKSVFEVMEQSGEFLNTNCTVQFRNGSFEEYVAYFDKFEEINNPESKLIYYSLPDEMEFQYYKGAIAKEITSEVNLIVIGENERISVVEDFLSINGLGVVQIIRKDDLSKFLVNFL